MNDTPPPDRSAFATLPAVTEQINRIVLGKERPVRLALACLLSGGHLLIEDLPGVGKTTLAHALAITLGLRFQRIQFTSDLLPADILGVSVYDQEKRAFAFHPGPIFAQLILADEINRATPKAQSALLEAMEERQVTVEGKTRPLPQPFFVIATQNPFHQTGTFPLPESQLDRFAMAVSLGYPDARAERALLKGEDRKRLLKSSGPVIDPEVLLKLRETIDKVHAADALLDYIQAILAASRRDGRFVMGLSPRAGLSLLRASRAWALLDGRAHVLPEDVQAVLPAVVRHRLKSAVDIREDVAEALLEEVPVP